jgi:hypothetical protein
MEVHVDNVRPFTGKISQDKFSFIPGEIIILPIPDPLEDIPEDALLQMKLPDSEKSQYNVYSIVGKYIAVKWSTKRHYAGIVIGYTNTTVFNLIFYNERTLDSVTKAKVAPSEDYFKVKLYGKGAVKWFLLDV